MNTHPVKQAYSSASTSFSEQAIFYYIKKVFPDAINRETFYFTENDNIELDIYVPSLHLAIEYDGAYWHKNKSARDNYKNLVLSNAGVYLIRVRENGLNDLEYNFGEIIYREYHSYDLMLTLSKVINEVFSAIKKYIERDQLILPHDIRVLLDTFYSNSEKLVEDQPNIYAQYYTTPQEDSIANSCLIKYWDYEKNGNLRPENVSIKSSIDITLTCHKGHSYCIKPSHYKFLHAKKSAKCKQCILHFCPALVGAHDCKLHCNVYQESINTLQYISKWAPVVRSSYNFIKYKKLQINNFPCSATIVKNPHYIWLKEKQKFYSKLETEKYTISSNEIVDFFMTINSLGIGRSSFEQFELIDYIASVGKNAPTLIQKTKDILSGKVVKKNKNGSITDIRIFVDNTLNPNIVINNLTFWGIEHFSFISLNIFDSPNVMDEFCETVLDSYKNTGWDYYYWNLTDKIKRDFGSLSADFCKKLYFLINQMNKIDHHYLIEDCINTLKTALYSI